jgi:hypothetical protein
MDVVLLISGPTVYICNECVDICNDIVGERSGLEAGGLEAFQSRHFGPLIRCRFCLTVFPEDQSVVIANRARFCVGCVELLRQHLNLEKR